MKKVLLSVFLVFYFLLLSQASGYCVTWRERRLLDMEDSVQKMEQNQQGGGGAIMMPTPKPSSGTSFMNAFAKGLTKRNDD